MRFCCLGSGSEGNGLVVESGSTRIMVDCGFTLAETILRLARHGMEPESISGIVVTHEHADHMGGVARFAARFGTPVWLTYGTLSAANGRMSGLPSLRPYDGHDPFAIGDIEVFPIPVPHDAREPVQYAFGDGARRLGLLTDIGTLTPYVVESLSGCDALVLECNHDPALLMAGSYPPLLKARIAGHQGHLANESAAELLRAIDCTRLQHLFAAHLSRENNTPALARAALSSALNCAADWIGIADQSAGFEWREIALSS